VAPLLPYATAFVGQPHTRSRGTIGGSVSFGSNVAEISVCLLALDAELEIASGLGTRRVPSGDFFVDYLENVLQPGEILTEIKVPTDTRRNRWAFSELKLRGCDFPIVMCAVTLEVDDAGVCKSARVAIGGGAPIPMRLLRLEEELVGRAPDQTDLWGLAQSAADLIEFEDDQHTPSEYRRGVIREQVSTALVEAFDEKRWRHAG
jgi:CO/xanthine dehydrogenase FAD-binding subunit